MSLKESFIAFSTEGKLVLIFGILVFGVAATQVKEIKECPFSSGQKEMSLNLKPHEWSCWVISPARSDYRFDATVDITACFGDHYCWKGKDSDFKDFGIRRGIFQFLSQEKGVVTITVENILQDDGAQHDQPQKQQQPTSQAKQYGGWYWRPDLNRAQIWIGTDSTGRDIWADYPPTTTSTQKPATQ